MKEASPRSWDEMHYRLVSLWDVIMNEFKFARFMELWTPLFTRHVVDRNMRAYEVAAYIEHSTGIVRTGNGEKTFDNISALYDFLHDNGLPLSANRAKLILDNLKAGTTTDEINRNIGILHGRIVEEAASITFLVLPHGAKSLYMQDDKKPFGELVHTRFNQRAAYEIEEAAKCLALRRYTASAFHLLRACEAGIHAMRKFLLDIDSASKNSENSWGYILPMVEQEVLARAKLEHPKAWMSHDMHTDFEQMVAAANSIKAWRDPTMHLEMKYDQGEAENLFALARLFMQKVSSRLNEAGALVS